MDRDIFVISDLHIGDGGPRDNFAVGDRKDYFLSFLDYVRTENGELIIVGDLLEFWQASFSRVIVNNLDLLNKLAELKPTYVLGNHDTDLKGFMDTNILNHPLFEYMSEPFTRQIGNKTFKFMHGHEIDPFNSGENPSWGRMLAIFAGIFEEKNGSPISPSGESVEESLSYIGQALIRLWNWLINKLKKVSEGNTPNPKDEFTPAQNPDRAKEMLAKYAADRDNDGYDIAIVGHTHQPGRIDDWYYNSGSWATTNNNFIRITPDGKVRIFDWKEDNATENNTVLDT